MAFKQQLQYETLRSVDTSTAAAYVALGTKLTYPAAVLKIINMSNKNLLISVDGTTDHDFCPSVNFMLYDVTSNSPLSNFIFVPGGRQYYVKTSDGAAGTGNCYLVAQYVPTN